MPRTTGFSRIWLLLLLMFWIFYPMSILAQTQPEVTASSPFLPVGSGARAMGMGGAFIAVADDATAASWNPAGLIQLKRPEISLVGSLFIRHDHSTFDAYPEASASESITEYQVNYLSLVFPGRLLGRNIALSLNYQHLYDMHLQYHRRWHYNEQPVGSPLNFDLDITWDYQKKGGLSAISPAAVIQITPAIAMGMTMNVWPESIGSVDNGWTKEFTSSAQGTIDDGMLTFPFDSTTHKSYRYTFSGTNFHFGFLWKINPVFSLGGVLKTPFSAELDRKVQEISIDQGDHTYTETREKQILTMPPSYGLGCAARLSDQLTLSLDLYMTEWDKHRLHTKEGTLSAVTDDYVESSCVKPTHHVRMGMEYLIINPRDIIAFRSGIFYDPDPSMDHPTEFFGFSLGSGIAFKDFAFDCAYQCRFAREISTISFQGEADRDRITQHFIYLSAIYYW